MFIKHIFSSYLERIFLICYNSTLDVIETTTRMIQHLNGTGSILPPLAKCPNFYFHYHGISSFLRGIANWGNWQRKKKCLFALTLSNKFPNILGEHWLECKLLEEIVLCAWHNSTTFSTVTKMLLSCQPQKAILWLNRTL